MDENIKSTIEALILSSPEPVPLSRLCDVIDRVSPQDVREAVEDLNNLYMGCGNSFRIREIAGGYQMYILPDFEYPVKKLLEKQRTIRLTRAALETLAIVAYKQPVTKSEIEHIRGVNSDGVIHNLLQRNLITITGRANAPGRPLLYKTSQEFLKFFGLNRLSDLPRMEEIEEMINQELSPENQTTFQFSENQNLKAIFENGRVEATGEAKFSDSGIPVLADIEAVKSIVPEGDLITDSGNGDGGNGDRQGRSILDDYEPIPGDPVPQLDHGEIDNAVTDKPADDHLDYREKPSESPDD